MEVFPDVPVTKKPREVRMGGGKGRETVDRRDGVGEGRKRERRGGERKRVRPKREKERNGEWLGDMK